MFSFLTKEGYFRATHYTLLQIYTFGKSFMGTNKLTFHMFTKDNFLLVYNT